MPVAFLRDGLELSYADAGPAGADVLVLVTGLGGLKEGWFRQVPVFSQRWRVVSYDNRGMGGSSVVDAPTSMADLAEDGVRLLDALDIERAHLWGVSMGGKIVQEWALGWPDRVGRVVLENTTAGDAHRVDPGPSPLRDLLSLDANGWLEQVVPKLFGPSYRRANAGAMRAFARSRERNPMRPVGFARQWESYQGFDSWERLPGLQHPVLVLVGEHDALCDPANGALLVERLPDARLHVVEDAGHSLHIEQPQEVNAVVARFLDE